MTNSGRGAGIAIAPVLIALSLSAGCSSTDTARAASGGASASGEANYVARAEPEDTERLICRREQPTGSRISEKVCMTAEDWEKVEQQSREMLDRATRKAQQFDDQQ